MRVPYQDCCLPKSIVGWVYNHATKNHWRVAAYMELDDLIQDGLMKAYECLDKYGTPGVDIDPPHFMALVKTAFYNHIGTLLRKSRAEQEVTSLIGDLAGEATETRYLDSHAEPTEPLQDLVSIITSMPETLRKVVALYSTWFEELRRPGETDGALLKRLIGFPLRFDPEVELRSFLWESSHL